jgi:hypothetical protein
MAAFLPPGQLLKPILKAKTLAVLNRYAVLDFWLAINQI